MFFRAKWLKDSHCKMPKFELSRAAAAPDLVVGTNAAGLSSWLCDPLAFVNRKREEGGRERGQGRRKREGGRREGRGRS